MEFVPQSIAATGPGLRMGLLIVASGRLVDVDAAGRQATTAAATPAPRRRAGWCPGPVARECAIRTCRHLTRSGMPPADTPSISGTDTDAAHGAPGTTRARRDSGQPSSDRSSAVRSSRSSRRTLPTCRSQTAARGQVGSTASGTGCRRQAAATVSTTSGLPQAQRCATDRMARGSRPSCIRTI